ncbi:MAG: protein BatD [Candidatus Hydrogenedentes bacterium]|nr:protein BatD [Candidatus Hydrogenedentota bacterium]
MRRAVFVTSLCACAAAAAHAGTITVSVDADGITKGMPFQIMVEIAGREIASVTVPTPDGASIGPDPNYSGTQINYTRGALTTTKTLGYVVTPERAGDLVIPPFKAEIDGEAVESQALHVTVQDSPTPDDATARAVAGDQILFTQIKTDKTEAYPGEAITLTMEVWIVDGARVRYDPTGYPELTGFYAVPREPTEPADRVATREGRRYKVLMFRQTLFPTSAGEPRVGPWTWTCDVGYRGVARGKQIATDPFTIKVNPLPAPPPGFSGSVGAYRAAAALSAKVTDVGVPVTLTVGVVGDGNPDAVGAPPLPAIDGAYVDEPQRSALARQPGVPGGANFVYKITPQRGGRIPVPAIEYVYFDPAQRAYQTARTEPLELHVRDSAKPEDQVVVGAGAVEDTSPSLGDDIVEQPEDAGAIGREGDHTMKTVAGYGAPVIAYGIFALVVRRRRRFETDPAFARAYGALRAGIERLDEARRANRAEDALYRAVTGYLADQFNLPETGMTSAEAHIFFESHGVPADIADAFGKILKACERARYAAAQLSADEVGALIQGAQAGMERLDQFLKRGRPV